ncbi:adenine methyltransferase [Paraburkholderia sp. LEh10]|uniref:DNA N-6-adenine-methyltransferase n=1 Tax=Paraburkholderia sp. LEh10 TaxID=2821353 RepID=UPI001AE4AC4B|nr:DNA N-6-adenine-methyltransferase [Paraburkholderia sp. LEh10]MBP0589299.1 adenine methyltransferase [Paraburkholderia sp. LEh10]
MSGMFGEHRIAPAHKSVEWYTPEWIFDELGIRFDMDPASPHDFETSVPANTKFTVFENGLMQPWSGRVWLNPPYGPDTPAWMRRFIGHANGIALVFSRTDALWCQEALSTADATLFLAGRIGFIPGNENRHKKARAGAGSVMFAFGDDCVEALRRLACRGVYLCRRDLGEAA